MEICSASSKALLVIDNSKIRSTYYSVVKKIVQKIDRVEQRLIAYHKLDQKLFQNWFALNFHFDKSKIEALAALSRELENLQNWVQAEEEMKKISTPKAYKIITEESERYKTADAATRMEIDRERQLRDEYIKRRNEGEYQYCFNLEQYVDEPTGEKLRSHQEEFEFAKIRRMSDLEIQSVCQDADAAFELFSKSFSLKRTTLESMVFLRIWDQVPIEHQEKFVREFAQVTGTSLTVQIQIMREDLRRLRLKNSRKNLETKQEVNDVQVDLGGTPDAEAIWVAEQERKLATLYRKLVRLLHPDLRDSKARALEQAWQERMWHRIQSANQEQDYMELSKLFTLTALRQKNFGELTIGEIKESGRWLEEELCERKLEVKMNRKTLAWGFSRKKSLESVEQKIRKGFDKEMLRLQQQIQELESQQRILHTLSQDEKFLESFPRRTTRLQKRKRV